MASAGMGSAFRQLRALFGGKSVVGLEDGQLLARFAADRDEAAFEALIERHGAMVLTTCRAVLRNEHDVEDAFQATFLVLAQKAGSIRGSDALGGWLHRVAYRASVQASTDAAQRRRKEAEAQAMATHLSQSPEPDRETTALLHAEINALPRSQRVAVILCDLQGLTYDQAATQLGWTVATFRNHLARGRQRLKTRLARRGLASPAIVGLLAPKPLAALPLGLVRATLSATTTSGAAATGAALLAHTLLQGMLMTKLKLATTAALAVLLIGSAGFLAAGSGKSPDEPKPTPKPKSQNEAVVPEKPKPSEPVEVRGIVVDPNGKPVAGATVRASVRNRTIETTSGPDGRFLILIPTASSVLPTSDPNYPCVMALAPGFGIGWVKKAFEPGPSGEITLRLVPDGPPIEGRILDDQGRPVADAQVKVKAVWVADGSSFTNWAAKPKVREDRNPLRDFLHLGFLWPLAGSIGPDGKIHRIPGPKHSPIETRTGADGRFRLTGLGGDRIVNLIASGPTIATTDFNVLTYDGPEIRNIYPQPNNGVQTPPVLTTIYHARNADLVAGPTRSIDGVIRDEESGQPIAGLMVQAGVVEKNLPFRIDNNVLDVTDAEGRYRLKGMPRADSYTLEIYGIWDPLTPYANASFKTPDQPNPGPIHFDFTLRRAVVVRGRVTEKGTGKPVPGRFDIFVFADNPFTANFTDLRHVTITFRTDAEGRFQAFTLPGHGLLTFRADQLNYRSSVGAPTIPGYDLARNEIPIRGRNIRAGIYHVLAEVNLDPKAESVNLDLQVDPGRSLKIHVIDPEGQPINGLTAEGTIAMGQNHPAEVAGSIVEVVGLDPSRPRRVTVFHQGRKLVGSVWLKGDEAGPLTIKLQPWGTVVGRIIDDRADQSRPLALSAGSNTPPTKLEEIGIFPQGTIGGGVAADKEGRFRIEGLVPGLKYAATALIFREIIIGDLFKDVTITPGEVKDLGDLKVLPWKP